MNFFEAKVLWTNHTLLAHFSWGWWLHLLAGLTASKKGVYGTFLPHFDAKVTMLIFMFCSQILLQSLPDLAAVNFLVHHLGFERLDVSPALQGSKVNIITTAKKMSGIQTYTSHNLWITKGFSPNSMVLYCLSTDTNIPASLLTNPKKILEHFGNYQSRGVCELTVIMS